MNINLIGMAGCGKSTLGQSLAKAKRSTFLDIDDRIEELANKTLEELKAVEGTQGVRYWEELALLSVQDKNLIIATGGSAVYSDKGMNHIQSLGQNIWLKVSYQELIKRGIDLSRRGLVIKTGQTIEDLFNERQPLYQQWADEIIECDSKNEETILQELHSHRQK